MSLIKKIKQLSQSQQSRLLEKLGQIHLKLNSSLNQQNRAHTSLSSFVVLEGETQNAERLNREAIVSQLQQHLPAYMVPNNLHFVKALPLTPNGKVDKVKLAQYKDDTQDSIKEGNAVSNSNQNKEKLLSIWRKVLGLSAIQLTDDFFALGGDSILAIQVVSETRKNGLPMKVSDLFKYRTVADLCTQFEAEPFHSNPTIISGERSEDNAAEKILHIWQEVLGNATLLADSHFFQSGGDSILAISLISQLKKNNFNVSVSQLFKYPTISALTEVIIARQSSQDSFTQDNKPNENINSREVSFTPIQSWFFENNFNNPDHWNQSVLLEITSTIPFESVKLAFLSLYTKHPALRLSVKRYPTHITQVVNNVSDSDLLIQHIVLENESVSNQEDCIIDSANEHHSRLKLSEGSLLRGTFFSSDEDDKNKLLLVAHHFCVDAVSWRILVDDLNAVLQSPNLVKSNSKETINSSFQAWSNSLQVLANSAGLERSYRFWQEQDYQLCAKLPFDFGDGSLNTEHSSQCLELYISKDISAGVMALATSQEETTIQMIALSALSETLKEWLRSDHLLIGIEGHGREDIDPALEPESVVGWLTSYFPLVLDLHYSHNVQQTLNEVQQQFLSLPDKGLSFGLGRYLSSSSEYQQALANSPAPEVIFNYLGRKILHHSPELPAIIINDTLGTNRDPGNLRASIFEINAVFENDRLIFKWQFSHKLHSPETVQRLLNSLSETLTQLVTDQRSKELAHTDKKIFYPLSELQQGFLFHRLSNVKSDQGELLLSGELHGKLSLETFSSAWQKLITCHTALRATLDWKKQALPYLIVHGDSKPKIEFIDLSKLAEGEQKSSVKQLLAKQRHQAIDIENLPGMNLTLIKHSEQCHTFIWACHHLFLDGWSSAIVLQDLLKIIADQSCDDLVGSNLRNYYDYIDALVISKTAKYWQKLFRKSEKCLISNTLKIPSVGSEPNSRALVTTRFDKNELNELKQLAMTLKVTPGVILAGCWSLVLANLSRLQSVCFGLTLSGRNHPIEDVQSLVGNLSNIVPFKVTIDPEQDLSSWLEEFMLSQEAAASHGQFSVGQIMSWAGHSSGEPLFDTVLSIANYPKINSPVGMQLKNYQGDATTIHPLSLFIIIGDEISFTFDYAIGMFSTDAIDFIAELFSNILEQVKAQPFSKVHSFVDDVVIKDYQELLSKHELLLTTAVESSSVNDSVVDSTQQDKTEVALLFILKEVLEITSCQAGDSFFDLGGTSLQAIRYFNEIENTFHKKLPMSSLFLNPSVTLLAKLIDDGVEAINPYKNLVQIKSGINLPPIFLIHAAGLDILFYKDLANRLDRRIPLYGLLPVGHDGSEKPLLSVPKMAERYIAEIKMAYPEGPYILLGHCFGFTIAYEIASQLEQQNAEVPLVISIDGPAPLPIGYVEPDWVPPLQRSPWEIVKGLGRITERFVQHRIDFLIDLWLIKFNQGSLEQRTELLAKRSEYAFGMANSTYRAKPVKSKILAFHCLDSHKFAHHDEEDWQRMAPEAILVKADCLHHEVLVEPDVQITATVIIDHLQALNVYETLAEPIRVESCRGDISGTTDSLEPHS